ISRSPSKKGRRSCGSDGRSSATVRVRAPNIHHTRVGFQEGRMSMLRKAMHYLGLAPDDEYEDDYYDDPAAGAAPVRSTAYVPPEPPEPQPAAVRPLPRSTEAPSGQVAAVRTTGVVRPLTPQGTAKPYAMSPTSFNEAQSVA